MTSLFIRSGQTSNWELLLNTCGTTHQIQLENLQTAFTIKISNLTYGLPASLKTMPNMLQTRASSLAGWTLPGLSRTLSSSVSSPSASKDSSEFSVLDIFSRGVEIDFLFPFRANTYPRVSQLEALDKCEDAQWMKEKEVNTFYPHGVVCYRDPSQCETFPSSHI